jgi:hypothetical protein
VFALPHPTWLGHARSCGMIFPTAGRCEGLSGIFICYRRDDTSGTAGRLFDRLNHELGAGQVFMDVDSIALGEDFGEVIEKAIASCRAVLVVIGTRWLDARDAQGRRRLDDPGDSVRIEIATARKHDLRIIPVLMAGAVLPGPDALPPDLAFLRQRNYVQISDTRFHADANRLIDDLKKLLGAHEVPASAKPAGVPPPGSPYGIAKPQKEPPKPIPYEVRIHPPAEKARAEAPTSGSARPVSMGTFGIRKPDAPTASTTQRGDLHVSALLSLEDVCTGKTKNFEFPGAAGDATAKRRVRVEIPAGIESGTQLRFRGDGEPAQRGQKAGDLYVTVQVLEHWIFTRSNADLHMRLPLYGDFAKRGGRVRVPSVMSGSFYETTIPPGTTRPIQLRLEGRGLPYGPGTGTGDLYVEVEVIPPGAKPDEEQARLLKAIQDDMGRGIT